MNQLTFLFQMLLTLLISITLLSCSSISEKPVEDEYFIPLDKVVHQKGDPGAFPRVFSRERYAIGTDDSIKKVIVGMLQEQNDQLDGVVHELSSLTNKELSDTLKDIKDKSSLASSDKVSNEALLEIIWEQNQRLNEVVERLKLFSRMKNNINFTRVQSMLVQDSTVLLGSSPEHLVTSLSYRKAIRLYQNRQYMKSIRAFRALLQEGVDITLQDNCHFWIGVCYFNLNRMNQAVGEFMKVLNMAGCDKRESAFLMAGQSYEQMGAKKFAEITFEKMLREYPQGDLKHVAEIKLALLR